MCVNPFGLYLIDNGLKCLHYMKTKKVIDSYVGDSTNSMVKTSKGGFKRRDSRLYESIARGGAVPKLVLAPEVFEEERPEAKVPPTPQCFLFLYFYCKKL